MRRRKQKLASESQSNLPLKVDEKGELSPDVDLLVIDLALNVGAEAVCCLLSIGHLGLAVHAMHGHPSYRANVEKLLPGIMPPFLQVLEVENPKLVSGLREDTRKTAVASLCAAALVYSHAILEDVLVRLCKLSVGREPQSWLAIISDRKISLKETIAKGVDDIKADALDRYVKDFERFTLLDKCRTLLRILQPKTCRRVIPKYTFSIQRLEQLDSLRHDIVHGMKFYARKARLRNQYEYFLKTGNFFITLTQQKYGFSPLLSKRDIDFDKLNALAVSKLEALGETRPSGEAPVAS